MSPVHNRPGSRLATRCALVVAGLILALPASLDAHARLKSSTPANGDSLSVVPRELRLDFTESPALGFVNIKLRDPNEDRISLDAVAYAPDSKRSIIVALPPLARDGRYIVEWQVAANDGHPSRGTFSFVIAPGAAGLTPVQSESALPDSAMAAIRHDPVTMPSNGSFGVEHPLYVIIRWAEFTGLLVLIGVIAFTQVVLRLTARGTAASAQLIDLARTRAARVGIVAAVLLFCACASRLLAQSAAVHGASAMSDPALLSTLITNTLWGRAWLVQVSATVMALAGLWAVREGEARRVGWMAAGLAVLALSFTAALSSHAAATPELTAFAIVADGLHVAGAGGWLGSLLLIVVVGIPTAMALGGDARGAVVADLINAFSPTALAFAALVGLTGGFAGWIHLGSFSALWQTGYGQALLVKLAIVALLSLAGAYNWLRVKRTLGEPEAVERIRRSATLEIAFGALVLVVTAVLVALPTAMDMKM